MKDNILIVTALFLPEPVVSANLSYDIAKRLSKKNSVIVLSPKPTRPHGVEFSGYTKPDESFIHEILDSYTFPKSELIGRMRESYSFGKAIARYISENKNDIKAIYANTWPLFGQFFLIKEAKKANIPVVLHVQDIYPDSISKKLKGVLSKIVFSVLLPLDKYILKNATKIVCISRNMINYLQESRGVNSDKFSLVRNWQNDEMFTRVYPKKESADFVFMYLGSISASAGVENLIEGFNQAAIKNSKLIIAGTGSDKEKCMAFAASLKNNAVVFCEAPQEEVGRMQSEADVLLLPLRKGISLTATPSKLTAYMLSGKPIIACVEAESDTAKILLDSGGGLICTPENIQQLSSKMKEVNAFSQHALWHLGDNARKYANENLSREANLEKIVVIIENVK